LSELLLTVIRLVAGTGLKVQALVCVSNLVNMLMPKFYWRFSSLAPMMQLRAVAARVNGDLAQVSLSPVARGTRYEVG